MNLAERIGFEANARLLIVHADDSGMCHGANWATAEAFRSGAISSTAVMVPCAWFESFAAECRDNPSWDVGVHITVTSEWVRYRWRPLTVAPSLVDGEGFFPRGSNEVADNAKVEEAAAEMRAQVERALEFGIDPTHIDAHMGTVWSRPDLFEAYVRLGEEYRLPMRVPGSVKGMYEQRGWTFPDSLAETLKQPWFPEVGNARGARTIELEPRRREYIEGIKQIPPGVSQVILHLGDDSAEMKSIMGGRDVASDNFGSLARLNDYRSFDDPEMWDALKHEGVRLIGWREIRDAMREGR